MSTHSFGMILRLDIEIMVLRQTLRFEGSDRARRGMCVTIWRVFSKLHIRFIDAPIATAMNAFATTPPVKVVSTRANAFSIVLMSVLLGFCVGIEAEIV